MILLDLQNCQAAYVPTQFQRSRFPEEYQSKLRALFDGIDRTVYHGFDETLRPPPATRPERKVAGVSVPPSTRIVTYVSRGFESMRGFDIFMRSAKIIQERYPDVLFVVVGSDKMSYGGDEEHIKPYKTFKEWTLAQQEYDLGKFVFIPSLDQPSLARLLATSDLHIYLTVPFVLSWSMMDAMSCGAVVLASATSPVKEMIRHGENGLLADFFSPEDFADKAVEVLKDPAAARPLGRAAEKMIVEKYSLEVVVPEMVQLYNEALQVKLPTWQPPPPEPVRVHNRINPPPQPRRPSPFL